MKKKDIKFNIVNEEFAKYMMDSVNNYYRIGCYKKNYYKNENGLYENLEFAYLYELSKIDFYLRSQLLLMTIDIEHSMKVSLLSDITESKENGYDIVKEFLDKYNWIAKDIFRKRKSQYVKNIIIKVVNNQI